MSNIQSGFIDLSNELKEILFTYSTEYMNTDLELQAAEKAINNIILIIHRENRFAMERINKQPKLISLNKKQIVITLTDTNVLQQNNGFAQAEIKIDTGDIPTEISVQILANMLTMQQQKLIQEHISMKKLIGQYSKKQ